MSAVPQKFTGQAAMAKQNPDAFELHEHTYAPRPWTEEMIDIEIIACGICGSDLHTMTEGWGKGKFPIVTGHEIVGIVRQAGSQSGHKVGDRVGFGAQCDSCRKPSCGPCSTCMKSYCKTKWTGTYGGAVEDGSWTMGGYADFYRGPGPFAVKIPEQIDSEEAAPLLCAGITTYSPLKFHLNGVGKGKRVAVLGIGGLGHLGVQFAAAMGAEVYALSHSSSKADDAKKLGAKELIPTKDEKAVLAKWAGAFDLILCTSFQPGMPLDTLYLPLLKPRGTMSIVGLPEEPFKPMRAQALLGKGIAGSLIGDPSEIQEMLDFCVEHNIRPWIKSFPLKEATQAVQAVHNGEPRYRYVLKP